jgi:hypothetical protein
MKTLIRYDTDDGPVYAEVELSEAEEMDAFRGRDKVALDGSDEIALDSGRRFSQVADTVRPIASSLVGRLRESAHPPDEVEVRFGLDLSWKAGAFIASTGAGAAFEITLTWRSASPP